MDRYRTSKSKKHTSVDGFLATGPRQRKPSVDSKMSAVPQSPRLNSLDNFSKPDGFYGQKQARMGEGGAYTNAVSNNKKEVAKLQAPSSDNSSKISPTIHNRLRGSRHDNYKPKKKRSKLKLFFRIGLITAVFALAFTGYIFGKAWFDAQKTLQGGGSALALNKELDPNTLTGEGDGRVNVLLLGKGGDTHEGGQLTDTIMIASIDPVNKGVVLISVPRDLWVKPDGLWAMKINAVYNSAKEQALYDNPKDKAAAEKEGINAIEKTVEQYLDVNINYYAMVDFTAFEEAVNILGGITVNLPEAYSDPTMKIGAKYLNLPAGLNELDGGTALGFARSRYGAERGDFDRGRNQQIVLMGIKDKVLSAGTFANPIKISQLISTFGNRVQTNFSTDDIMRLYDLSKEIKNENITNYDLAMKDEAVVTTSNIGGQSVVIPKAGVDDFSEVKLFVRSKLVDSFIIKESPTIIILNASGVAGAASKRADELKSYGYNVIQVADATVTDVPVTQLVDNTNGAKKYTKRLLELRFNTEAVKGVDGLDLTPYIADYIVVVGQNG